MRKSVLSLALLGSIYAPLLAAQESYNINATAPQADILRQHVLGLNRSLCRKWGLAATCTQAQVCLVAGAPGGSSCTAAQARGAGVRVWPDSVAGRTEFITWQWVSDRFVEAKNTLPNNLGRDYCNWWLNVANQAQRDAECTKVGAPSGCEICVAGVSQVSLNAGPPER